MYFRSRRKMHCEVSLFEPIGTDKEGNQIRLNDILESDDKDTCEELLKREQICALAKSRKKILSERENLIIEKRFALCGGEELTQREIASELGISRSYVSRIEKRALFKLKKFLTK